jgi:hypothetical protein
MDSHDYFGQIAYEHEGYGLTMALALTETVKPPVIVEK